MSSLNTLAPARFPRASRYLETLPNGLASYPECRVALEAFDDARERLAPALERTALPEPLASFVQGRYHDRFLPEAAANAALLMLRDVVCATDAAFSEWAYEDSRRVYRKPLYRVLMAVLSPSLVVLGAAKRWSAFHQGSSLTAERIVASAGRTGARATLSYPPRLFSGLLIERQAQAFRAAVEAAGGKEARVVSSETSETTAIFDASWTA